jgi:tripartite-type tricarboxylate transporter receptor subunit TctC
MKRLLIKTLVACGIATPECRGFGNRLTEDGQELGGGSPAEFDRFIRGEIAKYTQVIKAAGITAE